MILAGYSRSTQHMLTLYPIYTHAILNMYSPWHSASSSTAAWGSIRPMWAVVSCGGGAIGAGVATVGTESQDHQSQPSPSVPTYVSRSFGYAPYRERPPSILSSIPPLHFQVRGIVAIVGNPPLSSWPSCPAITMLFKVHKNRSHTYIHQFVRPRHHALHGSPTHSHISLPFAKRPVLSRIDNNGILYVVRRWARWV